ncbi:hypothetical protein DPMN_090008 [Dreissena polymorpha]|uniref:Uncharacterized protein n=1 Tax=Dreissena polymorpha TaxID=45954 RepID=A0A9D4KYX2_DREPO|nr:hypothetical protein DPMN_090008 [Dreissena polymorpha]
MKKSQAMMNSNTNTSADITMNNEKLEEVTCFKILGLTLSKDGTRSTEVLKNCLGDFNDGQTEQVVDKQMNQFPHQVQSPKVPHSFHPTVRGWKLCL